MLALWPFLPPGTSPWWAIVPTVIILAFIIPLFLDEFEEWRRKRKDKDINGDFQ
jgi:hypothetical protein